MIGKRIRLYLHHLVEDLKRQKKIGDTALVRVTAAEEIADWPSWCPILGTVGQLVPVGVRENPDGKWKGRSIPYEVVYGYQIVLACWKKRVQEVDCFLWEGTPSDLLMEQVWDTIELLQSDQSYVMKGRAVRRLREALEEEYGRDAVDWETMAQILGTSPQFLADLSMLAELPLTDVETRHLSYGQLQALLEEERALREAVRRRGPAYPCRVVLVDEDVGERQVAAKYTSPRLVYVDWHEKRPEPEEVIRIVTDWAEPTSGLAFVLCQELEEALRYLELFEGFGWETPKRPMVRLRAALGLQVDGPVFPSRCIDWVVMAVREGWRGVDLRTNMPGVPDWFDAPTREDPKLKIRFADVSLVRKVLTIWADSRWVVMGMWLRNLSFASAAEALGQRAALCHYGDGLTAKKHLEVWGYGKARKGSDV